MRYGNAPGALGKPKRLPPLSVGHRVFVNGVSAEGPDTIPLTDEGSVTIPADLVDGQAVEVLAWRQRPHVRYHVRCLSDGVEGWLDARYLRATRAPLPTPSPEERRSIPQGAAPARARDRRPPARGSRIPVDEPAAPPQAAVESATGDTTLARCSVCGKDVHPYNLSRNPKGVVVGCYFCGGRRPRSA
jgi:hypothetical protein